MWQRRSIDTTSREPRYLQLADILRDAIVSGDMAERLPSETDLVQWSGLGRTTVRHAVAVLRSEGLVVSERGLGTRVRRAGERTVTHIPADAEISARMPTEAERRRLGLQEGVPVLVVSRPGAEDEVLPADQHVIRYSGE